MELRSAKGKNILQRDSPRTMGTQLGRNYLSALKHLHLHPLFANQRPIRGRATRKDMAPSVQPLSAAGCLMQHPASSGLRMNFVYKAMLRGFENKEPAQSWPGRRVAMPLEQRQRHRVDVVTTSYKVNALTMPQTNCSPHTYNAPNKPYTTHTN